MRCTVAVLLLLIANLVVVARPPQTGDWVRFSSPEGRFSILFQKQPEFVKVPDADGKDSNFRYSDLESGYGFICEYFDLSSVGSDINLTLDYVRDGILTGANADKLSEKDIKLGKYPGREMELAFRNVPEVSGTVRVLLVSNRVYSVTFVRRKDIDRKVADEIANKFFSSFEVLS